MAVFSEAGLPPLLSHRLQDLFAQNQAWTVEEAVPYLKTFVVGSKTGDSEGLRARAAALLKNHVNAVHATERDDEGREVSITKYVALPH